MKKPSKVTPKRKNLILQADKLLKKIETSVSILQIEKLEQINKYLESGKCFVRSGVLFYRVDKSTEKAIWFPQGNAIEYEQDSNTCHHTEQVLEALNSTKSAIEQLNEKSNYSKHKVAINIECGGFALSREAVLLGRELSSNPEWGGGYSQRRYAWCN